MPELYRKRLIPSECIHLKNDTIVSISDGHIITRWKTLHPKEEFSYGISYYVVKHGWKISKFYKENGTLAYIYCDIIDTSYDKNTDTYIFTDLLADVIIENDGFVRVVDLDELADACRMSIISNDMLVTSLHRLNALLSIIYNGDFKDYLDELNILIQENDALMSKYHIKPRGIDRKLGKMLDAIGQDMDIAVSRSIAFNNPACREIIEMLPGTKKEEKAASFLQNTLCDALQTGCEDIKNILDDTFGDLNEEIPDAVEKVSAELKQANEELQKLSAEYSEENVKATTGNALQKISACDLVLGLLEVS